MPQRPEKRRRDNDGHLSDEDMPAPVDTTTNDSLNPPLPTWARKEMKQALKIWGNIQSSAVKKENAITKLEEHVRNDTVPRSLKINIKVMVSDEHQDEMDKVLADATEQFNVTILDGLKTIRKKELEQLEQDVRDEAQKWKQTFTATVGHMNEEGLLDNDQPVEAFLSKVFTMLQAMSDKHVQDIRTTDFHQRRKELLKQEEREKLRRQDIMREAFESDPEMECLQKQVTKLTGEVSKLSKNLKAKPEKKTQKNSGGGKGKEEKKKSQGKKNQGKKNQGQKGRTQSNRGNGKGGKPKSEQDGSAKGNHKRQPHSKRTTAQSASSRKNSRQRRN